MSVSIITINYNNEAGLSRTMASVIAQSYPVEYIVIDGGSTDGSRNIIQQYSNQVSYWISEPDKGIYNAMNKGIARATGDYLLFINSGDELYSGTAIAQIMEKPLSTDIVYGDILYIENDRQVKSINRDRLSFEFFLHGALPHPATFIRRELFDRVGLYDEQLKIASDWKFTLLAVCRYNCTYEYRDVLVAKFYLDGISSDPKSRDRVAREREGVLTTEFPAFIEHYQELEALRRKWNRVQYLVNPLKILNKFRQKRNSNRQQK